MAVALFLLATWAIKSLAEADFHRSEHVARDPSLEADVLAAVGPLPPRFTLFVSRRRGPGGRCARIAVRGVCPEIRIGPESGADVDLGDAAVDDLLAFHGPRPLLGAIMDAATRAALRDLARAPQVRPDSIKVDAGTLTVDARWGRLNPSKNAIVAVAAKVVALARRLQQPEDVPRELARNALEDPVRGVRLANVRTLLREHAGGEETRRVLRRAAAHADPELRLMAAVALGEEGRAVLLALARDTAIEDESCAGAIAALGAVPLADLQAILTESLRPSARLLPARPFTARACADALAAGGAAAVPLLAKVVQSRSEPVALAGVRALRRIDSAEAVLPLMQAAETGEGAVREAARRALENIQVGLTGSPGAVSLAGGEAGQVSVVDDAAGRVALPASERHREDS